MLCRRSPFRHSLLAIAAALPLAAGSLLARPAFARTDTAPDWVHSAASAPIPKLPIDTRAVVLLDETRLVVQPGGHASEHHRRVVRILRPKGRDDATVFLPFSSGEKLSDLHVWSIGPDGHEFTLKD